MKRLLVMLLFVLSLVGCGKKEETKEVEEKKPEAIVELENKEVEINEEFINTSGIVKTENCELITTEEKVDTSSLGEKEITIVVKDLNNKEKNYSFKLNVIDTKAPVISGKSVINTTEGNKVNLLNGVSVSDNSKENIKATVDGKYDFNKVGTYKLQYVAKDSSGNESRKDFSLVVKEKPVVKSVEKTNNDNKEKSNSSSSSNTSSSKPINGTSSSLNGTKTSKGYTITVKNGITYINGIMIANKTYPLPKSYAPGGLTSATKNAANEMIAAAKKDGVDLYVASGFRSYDLQNRLWTNRKNKNGIAAADAGTARSGHSEHQTGLAFDMCGSGSGCISSTYHNSKGAKWMAANAYKYGLILRYPNGKQGITGYKYESWHFRYVGKDLASKLYNNGNWITLEEYFGITSKYS